MTTNIIVQNLKCGGCASTITKGVSSVDGIEDVKVDVETSTVSFTSKTDDLTAVYKKLAQMGYPAEGDKNSIGQKAKSFVSCAVGRVGK